MPWREATTASRWHSERQFACSVRNIISCNAAHALATTQISAVRGDLATPATHAADFLLKRCSVVLRNRSVVVAQIPHSAHSTT